MSEGNHDDLPEVAVHKSRGVSLVWLIPAIALLVGGYLGIDAWRNSGVQVVITYPTAEWLEAGKTKIKFRSVEIGQVDEIRLVEGADGVELHCTLERRVAPHLTEGALFWIEHPRVGGGEISGLGTLLSGAFIGMRTGEAGGERKRRFVGLDQPPVAPPDAKGLRLVLHADELYSARIGTRVFYLQQEVGEVEAYELADDGRGFVIHLYIDEQYAHFARKDSRFWNAGGIQISANLSEIDVTTPSLASMLSGGIAFDSPAGKSSPAAQSGASYWLHPNRGDIDSYAYRYGGLLVVVEAPHLGGVKVGDAVHYREMTVGAVVSSELRADSRRLRLHLNIQRRYAPLVRSNSVFWNSSGISADLGLTGLHVHAESLQALLSGGIAFATPNSPGHRVEPGSVFKLHPEVKDKWLEWEPKLLRGAGAEPSPATGAAAEDGKPAESEGLIARFFHHEGKDSKQAAGDAEPSQDATQQGAQHARKHGHLKRR